MRWDIRRSLDRAPCSLQRAHSVPNPNLRFRLGNLETLNSQTIKFYLGLDAGATRCRARLRSADGSMRAEAEGGAGNIYRDYAQGVAGIRGAIAAALHEAGEPACANVALGLGIAGQQPGMESARLSHEFAEFAAVAVANDATIACLGAHAGADGGVIIAGTGSAGILRRGGRQTIIGGQGFLLGDDGSAARLGADALRGALRAHDGLAPRTPLAARLMARYGDDANTVTQWALTASPSDYGAFAEPVLEAAAKGDQLGRACVQSAVAAIAALAQALSALGAERIALVGGFGEPLRAFLDAALAAQLRRPLWDATDGAVLLAGGRLPQRVQP